MKILVCGLHRSGTSAVAHLIAKAACLSILDDPEWAIEKSPMEYRVSSSSVMDLVKHEVVKCPRMAEHLSQVLVDFPETRAIFVLRDPRDVWCSIHTKLRAGSPTRMNDYSRLDIAESGAAGFARAYTHYLGMLERCRTDPALGRRLEIVPYELFFCRRREVVQDMCRFAGLSVREDVTPWLGEQLAPHSNKPNGDLRICGPGRWRTEPGVLDLAELQASVAQYQSVMAHVLASLDIDPRVTALLSTEAANALRTGRWQSFFDHAVWKRARDIASPGTRPRSKTACEDLITRKACHGA